MTTKAPETKAPETSVSTNKRLEDLKKELPKIAEHEKNAENSKDYTGLNQTLSMIKFVLQNKPTQDEVDFARQFISELKFIKDETKLNLENLKDEKLLVNEIKNLLDNLKTEVNGIEKIDNNSSYEKIFSETKSDMILSVKKEVSDRVEFKFKNLKPQERENIKTAIISKISTSGITDTLVGGFGTKLKQYSDVLKGKDFSSILKLLDEDKTAVSKTDDQNTIKKLLDLLDSQITGFDEFIKKNEKIPNFAAFLSSSSNLDKMTPSLDLATFVPATPEEEKIFVESLKTKIMQFDNKLQLADRTKEQIFDQVTNLPDFISNGIAKFIAFLATIPFIGNFIKGFLKLEGTDEKDFEAQISAEFEARKSTKNLKQYGIQTGVNGEKEPTKKDPKIKILEDKDLSTLKHKELKDFFAYCKEKQVKTTSSDFWYKVFEEKKIEITGKDSDNKEVKTTIDFNVNIEEKDFDSNKTPKSSFYEKLNSLKTKKADSTKAPETSSSEKSPVAAPAATAATVAAGAGTEKKSEKPEEGKKLDLPKSINFDKKTSIATIDGTKYSVKLKNGNLNVTIDDFQYNNGSMTIAGYVFIKNPDTSGSGIFTPEEVAQAYSNLKTSGNFEGKSRDGQKTLIISKVV